MKICCLLYFIFGTKGTKDYYFTKVSISFDEFVRRNDKTDTQEGEELFYLIGNNREKLFCSLGHYLKFKKIRKWKEVEEKGER